MKVLRAFFVFLLFSCCFSTANAQTPPPKPSPENWLTKKGHELLDVLSIAETKSRYIKLRHMAKEVFNQNEMPRLAMGKYWKDLSREQQEALKYIFFDYFVVTYGSFNMNLSNVSFQITEKVTSGKDLLLKTKIKLDPESFHEQAGFHKSSDNEKEKQQKKNNDFFEILFAIRENKAGYYIRDAKFEGQSIIMFLRSYLEKELNNAADPEEFLDKMRKTINKKYRAAEELAAAQKEKESKKAKQRQQY